MKAILAICLLLIFSICNGQSSHTDQSGWKSSVCDVGVNASGAYRFEVAVLGYNTVHWVRGGVVFIEIFNNFFATGYSKYVLECGLGQGASGGSPRLRLLETYGIQQNGRVQLGEPIELPELYAGTISKRLPIYVDTKGYSQYKVKITYLQERVEMVTAHNQLSIAANPTSSIIPDFVFTDIIDKDFNASGNLRITGTGNHYLQNGNFGLGTTNPTERLSVNGNIRAKQIKVEMANWPDYVFAKNYTKMPLPELEQFIAKNKHLPEIPSAQQVAKEGIELGTNQAALLKKIEELTLYIIEQDKALKDYKKELGQVKDRLDKKDKRLNKRPAGD